MTTETFNDRVWYAWHCLPRSGRQQSPPSWKSLETKFEISQATFSKLCSNERHSVDSETLTKLAQALNVTERWLTKGEGERPILTGGLKQRGNRFAQEDPATWAAKYAAMSLDGRLVVKPENQFQAAVMVLLHELDPATIAKVAREAASIEDTKPAHFWGARLRAAEIERRERVALVARAEANERPKKKPKAKPAPAIRRAG